jgi:glycosyltransferase involved in cell wall biosynthesis
MHYADRTSLIRGRTFATGTGDRNVLWGCFNAPFRELMEARVSAGGAALYAPANHVVAFTKCVNELLCDSQRRNQMGEYGYRRVCEHLSWSVQREKLVRFYDHLIGDR